MKIFNIFKKRGAICGITLLLAFVATAAFGFPGFASSIVGSVDVLPKIGLVLAAMAAGFLLFCLSLKYHDLCEMLASFVLVGMFGVAALFILFGSETYAILSSWRIINGQPVDEIGTIVPISATAVVAIHIITLLGAFCLGKHLLYGLCDNIKIKTRRVLATIAYSLTAMFLLNGVIFACIEGGYSDNSVQRRSNLIERIDDAKRKLDRLETELKSLESNTK